MINKQYLKEIEELKEEDLKQYSSELSVPEDAGETKGDRNPIIIGNEKIYILNHSICKYTQIDGFCILGVKFEVKNVSDSIIGSVIFKVTFYNDQNNIVDEIEEKKLELRPEKITSVHIYTKTEEMVKSYDIRVTGTTMAHTPVVCGSDKVSILKHDIALVNNHPHSREWKELDLVIRNISNVNIATLVFEATFYDIEGNILDINRHEEFDLPTNTSRAICILTSTGTSVSEKYHYKNIWSYSVKIVKTITSDIQKVRIKWHNRKTVGNHMEEINGLVKNIWNMKTDTAIAATFFDFYGERLGTKVMLLKDIEPGSVRNFNICYTPPYGQNVQSYLISTGDIVTGVEDLN